MLLAALWMSTEVLRAESPCDRLLEVAAERLSSAPSEGVSTIPLYFDEARLATIFKKPESQVELQLRIYALAAIGRILSTNSAVLVQNPADPSMQIPVNQWLSQFTLHHQETDAVTRRELYLYQGLQAINQLMLSSEADEISEQRQTELKNLKAYLEARERAAQPQ